MHAMAGLEICANITRTSIESNKLYRLEFDTSTRNYGRCCLMPTKLTRTSFNAKNALLQCVAKRWLICLDFPFIILSTRHKLHVVKMFRSQIRSDGQLADVLLIFTRRTTNDLESVALISSCTFELEQTNPIVIVDCA